jgi:hypothetical protein
MTKHRLAQLPGWKKDGVMNTVVEFIKRHAVLTYYVVTFAISWGSALLIIGGPGRLQTVGEEVGRLFPALFLATVAGPGLAGILMTAIVPGRAGFQDLLSRLRKWRVNPVWYAVAILTTPLSVTASLLTLSLFSPEFRRFPHDERRNVPRRHPHSAAGRGGGSGLGYRLPGRAGLDGIRHPKAPAA